MTHRRGRPRNDEARAQVVRIATELFIRQGYVATTLGEIAQEAGVAVQTIYSAHGSKVGLIAAAHDVALAGDGEPVPLVDRAWFRALSRCESATEAWRAALDEMHVRTARVAPIYRAMLAAEADPEVMELMRTMRRQRAEFSRLLADQICGRPGGALVDRGRLATVIYATESVECYLLFVLESGWTLTEWRHWVFSSVARELEGQGGQKPA
ncbi:MULTISPECIES: TetR/AcrR family transcriptional regulator [unclassified Pseudactinotalea]|uniref:TetR/AcrR family transcriptional regulator n=1 Tax=Micrococcales TaxID=85006 RepID=UPI003C7EA19F